MRMSFFIFIVVDIPLSENNNVWMEKFYGLEHCSYIM